MGHGQGAIRHLVRRAFPARLNSRWSTHGSHTEILTVPHGQQHLLDSPMLGGLGRIMPTHDDARVRAFGTRVRLFPQAPFLPGFGEPEVVWLSPPAGTVLPGPADDRLYVVDAVDKPEPYEFPYLPPYLGAANPPVAPGPEGHFDHLAPESRAFLSVHAYGTVRRVLDIFESYFGRRLPWWFGDDYARLELIPLLDWNNAQSGYGYMELGYAA